MTFKQAFFKIYDRKISSGEISFSRTGIGKDEFTCLCSEPGYVLPAETLQRIVTTMNLTEEERELLFACAAAEGREVDR